MIAFRNFANARLASDITAAATNILVDNGAAFPNAPAEGEFVLVIEDIHANKEVVRCLSRSNEVLVVKRGQEGTQARSFVAGSQIEIRYTAGALEEYFQHQGIDSGDWSSVPGIIARKTLQLRRNYTEPNGRPTDLYEGELVLQMSTATPLLYVGPRGAKGNGAGVPILPIVIADRAPANPYEGLVWFDTKSGYQTKVYSGGAWRSASAIGTGLDAYATKTYVDAQRDHTRAHLWAPKGTRMLFRQSSAPAGWTRVTEFHDRLLRVVGTGDIGEGGSWRINGLKTKGHKLTVGEIPKHNHGGGSHTHYVEGMRHAGNDNHNSGTPNVGYGQTGNRQLTCHSSGTIIWEQGGDQEHAHDVLHDEDYRPRFTDVLLCEKA